MNKRNTAIAIGALLTLMNAGASFVVEKPVVSQKIENVDE